jgi:putative membrane protein
MEKSNFNLPQRQSVVGIVVLFADTFQSFVRAVIPLVAIWIFRFDQVNKIYLTLAIIAVIGITAVVAYIQYLNFTFYIDDENDEFIINKGVFNKTKIAIQLNKIQQVNINQSFIQRIIGVHALDVDTAGSGNKEVKIRAISHELAISLKARLLDSDLKKQAVPEQAAVEDHADTIIKISLLSLIKVGLTSKYGRTLAVLLAFFATIYENLQQWSQNGGDVEDKIDSYLNATTAMLSVSIFVFGLLLLILVINLGRTIIRYFDFRIAKQKKSLVLSYGLLNTRNTIIRPEKVQILTISRNYFQKKLDVLDIRIKQASVGESEKEERKSAIEIPGCSPMERDEILKLLLNRIPAKDFVLKPNIRKIIVSVFKFVALPIAALIVFADFITLSNYHYFYFVPVYLIIVSLSIYFGFRNNRLFISNDTIIKQSGVWDIDQEIIEIQKIQAITTSQLFWHKRPNIGTITLHTAGGNISFRLANFTHIRLLANTWLYQVETSGRSWNS